MIRWYKHHIRDINMLLVVAAGWLAFVVVAELFERARDGGYLGLSPH